jgi:hypothetical protein
MMPVVPATKLVAVLEGSDVLRRLAEETERKDVEWRRESAKVRDPDHA